VPATIIEQPALLEVATVATRLNISPWRTYDLIRRGHLRAVRFGRAVRVDPRAVEDFIRGGGTATSGDES
jgi:excisionase family DNA binding protein